MINYPLGDFLIRIKNGYSAQKKRVALPWSKIKEEVAKLLVENSFLAGYKTVADKNSVKKELEVKLKYLSGGRPALEGVVLFSKPGRRFYVGHRTIPYPRGGKRGMVILSTPQGIMRGKEARKKKLGGEVIGMVW